MGAFIIDEKGEYIPVYGDIPVVEHTFDVITTKNNSATDAQVYSAKCINTILTNVIQYEQYGTIVINV